MAGFLSGPFGLGVVCAAWAVLLSSSIFQDAIGLDAEARVWLLDVDMERSFYTWFSQTILALTGLLLADTGIKSLSKSRGAALSFLVLGAVFFLLSADEGLSFHEVLSARMGDVGGLQFAWVIPAAIFCMAGLAVLMPFLRSLGPRVMGMMLAAAGVFMSGALGMEAIGGEVLFANNGEIFARPYRLLVNIEEGAEGLGVILFLFALVRHREEAGLAPGISLFR
ncbi:hypothetical protein [Paracoccus chinensis]|nr:hypothetical protein [Paracoccus chinensis]